MPSIDFNQAIQFIIILLISIDIHELAHAVTAYQLGDQTPARNGQLSLNPFVHMDQFGVIVLVLSSLSGFPFAWGRTFIQPQSLRFGPQRGGALVAAAGPLANLLLACLLALALRFDESRGCSLPSNYSNFMALAIYVNTALFVFNLIPLPPLDGFSILSGFLTTGQLYSLQPLIQYGPMVLFLLIALSFYGGQFNILGDTIFRGVNQIDGWLIPSWPLPLVLPQFCPGG